MPHTKNTICAAILIMLYLALPATNLLHAATLETGEAAIQATSSAAPDAPCDDTPCSGEPDGDCCDTPFCNCSCHAPLVQHIELIYSPVIITHRFHDPQQRPTQVYRSIVVPPQNHA